MARPTPESRLIAALRRRRGLWRRFSRDARGRLDSAYAGRCFDTALGIDEALHIVERWAERERRRRGR